MAVKKAGRLRKALGKVAPKRRRVKAAALGAVGGGVGWVISAYRGRKTKKKTTRRRR